MNLSQIYAKNLNLFVILSCLFMQILGLSSIYRSLAYLNLILVLIYGFTQFKQQATARDRHTLASLLIIPVAFSLTHFLAVQDLIVIKEIRHIFVAVFLMLGIWLLAKKNTECVKKYIFISLLCLILGYVFIQAVALWYFKQPYGITKNPHYLALYSAILLILSVFCFFKASSVWKVILAVCGLLLGAFILGSASRPTWIGLIVAALCFAFLSSKRTKVISFILVLAILIGLSLLDIGNFSTHFGELIRHIHTEERVIIWLDAWRMQTDSSLYQWVFGHGLNAFEDDFKQYSNYHLQNIDFNGPHNYLLELLYLSGILGLAFAVAMFSRLYMSLYTQIKRSTRYRDIYLLLLVILTSNLVMVSITIPFFTTYNLNIIAVIVGVMLYLRTEQEKQIV